MENRTETEKGEKGSLMWLSAVNMQGGAVGVKVLQVQGKEDKAGRLGWLYPYALAVATRTTHTTEYTRRRNQQTRCAATPECGILITPLNILGTTHRTVGGALASGRGRAS